VGRRIDIEPDNGAQLGRELRVLGMHPVRTTG
jgi:hypothetical protein